MLSCHCTLIKPDNGHFKTVYGHMRTCFSLKEKTNTSEETLVDVEYDMKFDLGELSLHGTHIRISFLNCES